MRTPGSTTGQSVYNPAKDHPGFNPLTTPYLNNAYFSDPNPNPKAAIRFGLLPRVTNFRTEACLNEDVSLMKRFHFTESVMLEFRADAFNVANQHVLAQPYNLGPNPNAGASSNFGYVNGTSDTPRLVQIKARIRF